MAANSIATEINHVPPEEVRAKVLNRVYQYILSLPDPREQKTEPAADDLSRKAEAGSADETPELLGDCRESTREVNSHAI